jgi:hypothetical protein
MQAVERLRALLGSMRRNPQPKQEKNVSPIAPPKQGSESPLVPAFLAISRRDLPVTHLA